MGTGEAVMMSTAHLRHAGHSSIGPTGVEAQSNSSMSFFISLVVEGGMGVGGARGVRGEDRIVFVVLALAY